MSNVISKRKDNLNKLESLIDSTSLNEVIGMLADICTEKAQHVRENWQDERLAKCWDKNATTLNKVTAKLYS